ncbi:MAG: alpha-L-fucosidase [Lachnospiraceae bacterium]|nr:alpha-L-fucosidase [Lachnospiraceae bacterium]
MDVYYTIFDFLYSVYSRELFDTVKSLQPDCIVSGRIGNDLGEYMTTSDNFLPRLSYEGDWELPATLNDTWGYKIGDENFKSPDEVIRLLLKVVSRGGNYLLNIGPDGTGAVPKGSLDVLNEVGKYVKENGEGIFGTKAMPYYPYELDWAELTRKEHKLYVHVLKKREYIELPNIANHSVSAKVLKNDRALEPQNKLNCEEISTIVIHLPKDLWKETNYCVEITLQEEGLEFLSL